MGRRKSYERRDERTEEQRQAMPLLVAGVDTFLSGWGGAAGGASVAAWACRESDVDAVFKWVKSRSDMRRVRLIDERDYMGRVVPVRSMFARCVHLTIYPVEVGHPALAAKSYCEKCRAETAGTRLCLGCSPRGALFKGDPGA